MKLTDFLEDVGRPVAYYPALARTLGGVKQAVFLCQLIYWTGKGTDPDGWIYKSQEELRDETGLSFDEQRTARKALCKAGLVEERYARLEHRLYFRVDKDELNEFWKISRCGESQFPEMGNGNFGKSGNLISGNGEPPLRYRGTENTSRDYYTDYDREPFPFKEDW